MALQVEFGEIEMVSSFAEMMIESVDWFTYQIAGGSAVDLPVALRALLASSGVEAASTAWDEIEEHVFSQGTIYSAAEPTVSVMLAALTEDQPSWRSGRILDLIFFIVRGISLTDSTLQQRCRERAREGVWLLAHWALLHEGWTRDNALEIIDTISPDQAKIIRAALPGR